ncbi:unnamed protein product, partial [Musa textilis]
MAETKMVVVALLLVALVMTSSTVPAADALCFPDCYARCANGVVGNVACSTMCSQACIVPKTLPDGTDLASLDENGTHISWLPYKSIFCRLWRFYGHHKMRM